VLITGNNFGAPGHFLPVVTIGRVMCNSVARPDAQTLWCTLPPSVVGRSKVRVSFAAMETADEVVMDRMCGAGAHGFVGETCGACPQVHTRGSHDETLRGAVGKRFSR
jgi:hypothetical protein